MAAMKICIVGAGAVGGHLAARLHASKADVSVLARGATLAAIRERGILLRAPDGEIQARVRAAGDAQELGPQDVVVFAVKAQDLAAAAENARALFGKDTRALFVVNGIPWWYAQDGATPALLDAGRIARVVAPERSIGSAIYSLCSVPEPGVVEVRNPVSRLILGDVPAGNASPFTLQLAEAFRSDAMKVEVSNDIRDQVWDKLIMLLATIPLSVLAQATPAELFKEPACADTTRALVAEMTAAARKLRRTVTIDAQSVIASNSAHRPSILQDLEAGRRMEVDALFTAPIEMARTAGVPVPMLEMLTALVKVRARSAGLY
jgi:2-dehydropantoate 2-reductase